MFTGIGAYAQDKERLEAMRSELTDSLGTVPDSYWNWMAHALQWLCGDQANAMVAAGSKGGWDLPFPVVLVSGALAPASACQESSRRLHQLILGSQLSFIPDSKYFWLWEGTEQLAFVIEHFDRLLTSVSGQ